MGWVQAPAVSTYGVCGCSVWPVVGVNGVLVGRCERCGTGVLCVGVRPVSGAVEAFVRRNGYAPFDVMP